MGFAVLGGLPRTVSRAMWRSVVAASASNVASTAAAGLAGIVIARSLGPSGRGEYAAIMVWTGLMVIVGGLGQSVAYFVARDPARAADYVATLRSLLVASGVATMVTGVLVAPWLGSLTNASTWGYRLMFATCLGTFLALGYTFALQGSSIARWSLARVSQPVAYLAVIVALHAAGWLNLLTALAAVSATIAAQAALAYGLGARIGLASGRAQLALAGPLGRNGAGQMAAIVPILVISKLDQLALSLTVDPAMLGSYAVAASLTTLAVPIAAGVGNVAFPRIAAHRDARQATAWLQWRAVWVSAGIGLVLVLSLAALAPWIVPLVFGAGFQDAVILVALLAPRGALWACQQVTADLLRGHGLPFAVARAQLVGAGLTVLLLAALLPILGGPGAAVASSVSAGVSLLLLLRALRRALTHGERKKEPS